MHKVELRKGFTGERRNRAGLMISRTEPVEVELSKEQLEAVNADPELTVTEVKSTAKVMVDKQPTKRKK